MGGSAEENCTELGTEERGDLIKFYNAVYVGRVKSFALKYDVTNQDHVVSKIYWSFALKIRRWFILCQVFVLYLPGMVTEVTK